jgi:hypothetical protein
MFLNQFIPQPPCFVTTIVPFSVDSTFLATFAPVLTSNVMEKYKKDDYIVVRTNHPDVHASWMVNSGLTSEDIEPSEYVAKIKSVIGDGESYLVYIPSIGFRCVVDVSEVLRRVSEEEQSDDEKGEDDTLFIAPNVYTVEDDVQGENVEEMCQHLAMAAMKELFPEDTVVSVELCHSDYLKSDLRSMIDRLIRERCSNKHKFQKKRDYFNEMLEHLRFKEYYNIRIGIEDKLDEGAINYVYAAVDNRFNEVSVMRDFYADTQRFVRSLGPEYDSVKNYFRDLRSEILSIK